MKCPLPPFSAEDFKDWAAVENPADDPSVQEWCAKQANALLEARWAKLVEGATELRACPKQHASRWWAPPYHSDKHTRKTLIFPSLIEEIENK